MRESRGVNFDNVIKLLKFLKEREIEVPLIDNNIEVENEELWRSYDNKSENDYGDD